MKIGKLALAMWASLASAAHLEYGYMNDYGKLVDGATDDSGHTCVVLRSVEWFANSLIEEANKINARDGRALFMKPEDQDCPLAHVLRAMMIWTQRLELLKMHLLGVKNWGTNDQLQAAKCYIDYSFQASAFLDAFGVQAIQFSFAEAERELVFSKLQDLYLTHKHVGTVLHGNGGVVDRLLKRNFPKVLDKYWLSKAEAPEPGSSIGDYIKTHDHALSTITCGFKSAALAWKDPRAHPGASELHCGMDGADKGTDGPAFEKSHAEVAGPFDEGATPITDQLFLDQLPFEFDESYEYNEILEPDDDDWESNTDAASAQTEAQGDSEGKNKDDKEDDVKNDNDEDEEDKDEDKDKFSDENKSKNKEKPENEEKLESKGKPEDEKKSEDEGKPEDDEKSEEDEKSEGEDNFGEEQKASGDEKPAEEEKPEEEGKIEDGEKPEGEKAKGEKLEEGDKPEEGDRPEEGDKPEGEEEPEGEGKPESEGQPAPEDGVGDEDEPKNKLVAESKPSAASESEDQLIPEPKNKLVAEDKPKAEDDTKAGDTPKSQEKPDEAAGQP